MFGLKERSFPFQRLSYTKHRIEERERMRVRESGVAEQWKPATQHVGGAAALTDVLRRSLKAAAHQSALFSEAANDPAALPPLTWLL
jgi:hypothetical protein